MNLKKKRILVTGATGFNGSHLVKGLVKNGAEVHVLYRPSSSFWRLIDIGDLLHFHLADISNSISMSKLCQDVNPDIVFHLAAHGTHYHKQDIQKSLDVNLIGTMNLIKGLEKTDCEKLIYTSSFFEYGHQDNPIQEDTLLSPSTPYCTSKVATSYLAPLYAEKFNLPLIILRLFNVYGEFDNIDKFVPYIILSLLKKEIPKLTACLQTRDFIFIEDVVDAYLKATNINQSTIMNIGSGIPVTLKDVVVEILKHFENGIVQFGEHSYRKNDIWKSYADITKAKKIMNWKCHVSLEEGIFRTVEWYRKKPII